MGGPNFCWRLCLGAGLGLHLIADSEYKGRLELE